MKITKNSINIIKKDKIGLSYISIRLNLILNINLYILR